MTHPLVQRNNIKVIGEGQQIILFVHGYGCSQKMWSLITPAFEKNYRVILIDLVGSGDSDLNAYDPKKYSSLKGYASDILEICEEFSYRDIIFVGHSVSSMVGMHAAIAKPSLFKNLIMIGPSPSYINDGDYLGGFEKEDILELIDTLNSNYLGWSSAITPVIMGPENPPELSEELNNSFCQTDPDIAKHFAKVTFMSDDRSYIEKISTDTLIIQCSSDLIAPEAVGEYLHSKISSSSLKKLKATGHCPHMSAPHETTDVILNFLSKREC
jgi:sigma-B regulation protein RsbQ